MTTYDFSPLFRSTIGFDRLAHLVEDAMRADGAVPAFPAYNIEKHGPDAYRITLAVAGYAEDDLDIESVENAVIVSGRKRPDAKDVAYLHRGIAEGAFKRTFQLADYVRVKGATFERGLLHIDLVRELPDAMKPRHIEIKASPVEKLAAKAKKLIEGDRGAA
jgi:molecular chaperone IbpA